MLLGCCYVDTVSFLLRICFRSDQLYVVRFYFDNFESSSVWPDFPKEGPDFFSEEHYILEYKWMHICLLFMRKKNVLDMCSVFFHNCITIMINFSFISDSGWVGFWLFWIWVQLCWARVVYWFYGTFFQARVGFRVNFKLSFLVQPELPEIQCKAMA